MDGFNPQELANTAWGFATADQKDVSLFTALAVAAERRMDGFSPRNLANTAWGFATTAMSKLPFAATASGFVLAVKVRRGLWSWWKFPRLAIKRSSCLLKYGVCFTRSFFI